MSNTRPVPSAGVVLPNPIQKACIALEKAEEALLGTEPNLALADAWGSIAKQWLSFIDPRDPAVRMMVQPERRR